MQWCSCRDFACVSGRSSPCFSWGASSHVATFSNGGRSSHPDVDVGKNMHV